MTGVLRKNANALALLKPRGETRPTFGTSGERATAGGRRQLTDDIQVVGVIDGPVLVLHHAGVIAFVGWNHALHDEAPMLVSYLKRPK